MTAAVSPSSTFVRSRRLARAIAAQISYAGSAVTLTKKRRGCWQIETDAADDVLAAVCRRHFTRILLFWESKDADGLVYFRSPWQPDPTRIE